MYIKNKYIETKKDTYRIVKECFRCKKYFLVKNNKREEKRKFCSKKCAAQSNGINNPVYKEKIVLLCNNCNNKFSVILSKSNAKFCSKECYSEFNREENHHGWKGGSRRKKCMYCDNKISIQCKTCRKCSGISQRKPKNQCIDCNKILKSRYAKRCRKCSGKQNGGKNHYCWKGGMSEKSRQHLPGYKKWRKEIFKRDFYTCQFSGCNYKGKDIEAHHILTVKSRPDLILSKDNGITLCCKCHHNIRGKEKDYIELFKNIIEEKSNIEELAIV